jgi:hypothetical protein
MAVMGRAGLPVAILLLAVAKDARAQTAVRGDVLDAETGAPLQGALVTSRGATRAVTTDRLGRFTLWIMRFPDTLTVAMIGRAPAAMSLPAPPTQALHIGLEASAVTLSDVIVRAPASVARPLEDVGRWQVPAAAGRGVPPAIETDIIRALTLVPAVSFSTPLSSRPIIRGYDAGESSLRIDGFEVLNLYHIGRVFSAFPADAASQVSVATAPQGAATGGTLAGTVDITGQVGEATSVHGGADLSLASAQGWAGGGGEGVQWFGGVRAVYLSVLNAVSEARVPYDFQDIYANALLSAQGRPAVRITAFASRDHLFDRDLGTGMDWSNLLLGARWQVLDDGRRGASLWANANRFAEDVSDVPARYSRIEVRNRFERFGIGGDASIHGARSRLAIGFSAAWRTIANRIEPLSGEDFPATDANFRSAELGLYAELTRTLGRALLQAGVRLDAGGDTRVLQPRARLAIPIAAGASVGVAVGRTARLYHLVSDPMSEPDFAFYDFWLNAGEGGIPVPIIDHGTIDLDVVHRDFAGRLSLFASRGRGLVELRPVTDQRAEELAPFRYGRGRSRGVEAQLALRGKARALSATYVLASSERDWGTAWIPWSQDRRHVFRLFGRTHFGSHWSASLAFEGTSGAPVTLVDGVLLAGLPVGSGNTLQRDGNVGSPAYIYAEENGGRSAGTARMDLGATYAFTGPWKSRMALGLSIINAGFGPVAPLRPSAPTFEPGPGGSLQGRVRYERLFDLPAVPSLTLRIEF